MLLNPRTKTVDSTLTQQRLVTKKAVLSSAHPFPSRHHSIAALALVVLGLGVGRKTERFEVALEETWRSKRESTD
jgi:hypothetical protein